MKILLLQLDGSLPNLALLRIAAHHRARGDQVDLRRLPGTIRMEIEMRALEPPFWEERPDIVYASLIFEKSRPLAKRAKEIYPGVILGGTGWDETTMLEQFGIVTREKDYSLYPDYRHSIGYTQRGCRLNCSFCKVPRTEGKVRKDEGIGIWRGEPWPRNLCLLDNDFFGEPDWEKTLHEIDMGGFRVNFTQGINVRTLTDDQARKLSGVRYSDTDFRRPRLYTAWDNRSDEDRLFRGLERLRFYGVRPDNIMVYILVGYDHEKKCARPDLTDDDFHRHKRLREFGCRPYPMPFVRTPALVGFQRWIVKRLDMKVSWERFQAAKWQPSKVRAE